MRLDVKAMALGFGILWGGAMLLTGIANLIWPGYGAAFLQLLASIYPGYDATGSFGDVIVGVLYALVDGAVFGLVFAWLYNRLLGGRTAQQGDVRREAGARYAPVEPGP